MKLPRFHYHAPFNLKEASQLLVEFSVKQEKAVLLAGGSDILSTMKQKSLKPAHVVRLPWPA